MSPASMSITSIASFMFRFRRLVCEERAYVFVEHKFVATQLRIAPANHAPPRALIVLGKQRAGNARREALRPDADPRNVAGDRPVVEVSRKGKAVDAVDPWGRARRTLKKLERRSDEWMIRLCELSVAFRPEMIAPELDMRLERGEFRPLAPIDRQPGRQNKKIEDELPPRGVEQYAAVADLDRPRLATRQNGKILVTRHAQHRVPRRRHRLLVDVVHDLPFLRIRERMKADPEAGAADAHALVDARHVRPPHQHGDACRAMLQCFGGIIDCGGAGADHADSLAAQRAEIDVVTRMDDKALVEAAK